MRRRARFLRRARELAYRDLGGLVFDLHRFGQRNDQLVLAKLAMLRQIDTEVRELEGALHDRRPVTVLREVGIAACPRCAAIHDSDDRFCPGCGLAFDTNADRPISTAPMAPRVQTPTPVAQPSNPAPNTASMGATGAVPTRASMGGPATSPPAPPSTPTPAMPRASARRPDGGTVPAPPVKPTAPPVASRPAAPSSRPAAPAPRPATPAPIAPTRSPRISPERPEPDASSEDEPTQILRPREQDE